MFERRSFAGAAVETELSDGINQTSTNLVLKDATGWPDGTAGSFYVAVDAGTASEEKILISSRSGDTLSVDTRGVDGTAAQAHAAGADAYHCLTAADLDEANAAAHATLGTVTANGDLLVGAGSGQLARLARGDKGQLLAAGSTGLEWTDATSAADKITAAGQLLVGSAKGKLATLAAGSDGQMLTADSSAANGLAFADVPASAVRLVEANGSYPSRPSDADVVTFVGSGDPGSAAHDGDVWLKTGG
jgi:hypothetical protein